MAMVTQGSQHELRHGEFRERSVLASAELLSETPLDHSQASFLQTVQACGTSLVETVNHVLDFTKLSGNAKAGGVENVIHLSRCAQLSPQGCGPGTHAVVLLHAAG